MSLHTHEDGDSSGDRPETTERRTRRLALVAVIDFVGFRVELAGGLLSGSVALVSGALHPIEPEHP